MGRACREFGMHLSWQAGLVQATLGRRAPQVRREVRRELVGVASHAGKCKKLKI